MHEAILNLLYSFSGMIKENNQLHATSRRIYDSDHFYAPMSITEIFPNKTRGQCLETCMLNSTCMMFAMDSNQCILTNTEPGDLHEFWVYKEWYLMN